MNAQYSHNSSGASMEERLWDYIDGLSPAGEKAVIEELLAANAEWQAQYDRLLELHQLIQSSGLEEPSMRFTKNVMDEISRVHIAPAAATYINKNIIRGISIFLITMITGFFIYGFAQIDWKDESQLKPVFDLSNIDLSKFFNNTYMNVFMMINVILGLFLLDRYLANKRKKLHKEN